MQAPANTRKQEMRMITLKEIRNLSGFLCYMSNIPAPSPHGSFKIISGFESSPCFTNRALFSPVHVLLNESSPCFTKSLFKVVFVASHSVSWFAMVTNDNLRQ